MSEHLPDVKELTPEQEARAIELWNEAHEVPRLCRVIVYLQEHLAGVALELLEAEADRNEAQRLLNSEWFNRVTYKQQARAAQDRVAELERALVYSAFRQHGTPLHQLPERIALLDNDTVEVRFTDDRRGPKVVATWPPRAAVTTPGAPT